MSQSAQTHHDIHSITRLNEWRRRSQETAPPMGDGGNVSSGHQGRLYVPRVGAWQKKNNMFSEEIVGLQNVEALYLKEAFSSFHLPVNHPSILSFILLFFAHPVINPSIYLVIHSFFFFLSIQSSINWSITSTQSWKLRNIYWCELLVARPSTRPATQPLTHSTHPITYSCATHIASLPANYSALLHDIKITRAVELTHSSPFQPATRSYPISPSIWFLYPFFFKVSS